MVSLAAEFPNDNPALHCGVSWVCLEVTGAAVAVREERPRVAPPEPIEVIEVLEAVAVVEPVAVVDPGAVAAAPEVFGEIVAAAADLDVDSEELPVPEARISCVVPVGQDHSIGEDEDDIVVEDLPPLDESASLEGAVAASSVVLPAASDDAFTVLLGTLVDVALAAGSPHVASVLPVLLFEGRLAHGMSEDVLLALAEGNIATGTELTPAFAAQMNAWRAILLGTSDDFGACGASMLDEWAADLLARLLGAPSRATVLRRELRSHGVAAFGLAIAA